MIPFMQVYTHRPVRSLSEGVEDSPLHTLLSVLPVFLPRCLLTCCSSFSSSVDHASATDGPGSGYDCTICFKMTVAVIENPYVRAT